jgi:hypothetical protein
MFSFTKLVTGLCTVVILQLVEFAGLLKSSNNVSRTVVILQLVEFAGLLKS